MMPVSREEEVVTHEVRDASESGNSAEVPPLVAVALLAFTCCVSLAPGVLLGKVGNVEQCPPLVTRSSNRHVKHHFSRLGVRNYHDIFFNGTIDDVIAGGSPFKVAPRRYVQAAAVSFGISLNLVNITHNWWCTLPVQLQLLDEFVTHDLSTRTSLCTGMMDDLRVVDLRCSAFERSLQDLAKCCLVYVEVVLLAHAFFLGIAGIRKLPRAATEKDWMRVGQGFCSLQRCTSISALRLLPLIRTRPGEIVQRLKLYKAMQEQRSSKRWKLYLPAVAAFLFLELLKGLVFILVGAIALHAKVEAVSFVLDVPMLRWGSGRCLAFAGFVNQVAGLVPVSQLKKDAFLFFIFTGEDAEMQPGEHAAMKEFHGMLFKRLFSSLGWVRGVVAAFSLESSDFQKIVLCETQHADSPPDTPVPVVW